MFAILAVVYGDLSGLIGKMFFLIRIHWEKVSEPSAGRINFSGDGHLEAVFGDSGSCWRLLMRKICFSLITNLCGMRVLRLNYLFDLLHLRHSWHPCCCCSCRCRSCCCCCWSRRCCWCCCCCYHCRRWCRHCRCCCCPCRCRRQFFSPCLECQRIRGDIFSWKTFLANANEYVALM